MRRIETAPPQPVYELHYTQTPATVASMVKLARNQINQLNLAQRDLPIGLGVLGLLLLLPAVVRFVRRRPELEAGPGQVMAEPAHHFFHHRSQAA